MFIRSSPSSFHLCVYTFAVFMSGTSVLKPTEDMNRLLTFLLALIFVNSCCIYVFACLCMRQCVHAFYSYIVSSCAFPGKIVVLCVSCSMLRSHMVSLMSVWLYTASRFSLWRGRHIRLFICQSLVRTKTLQYNPNTVANLTRGSVCMQCLFLAFLLPGHYFLSFLSHSRRLLLFSLA